MEYVRLIWIHRLTARAMSRVPWPTSCLASPDNPTAKEEDCMVTAVERERLLHLYFFKRMIQTQATIKELARTVITTTATTVTAIIVAIEKPKCLSMYVHTMLIPTTNATATYATVRSHLSCREECQVFIREPECSLRHSKCMLKCKDKPKSQTIAPFMKLVYTAT